MWALRSCEWRKSPPHKFRKHFIDISLSCSLAFCCFKMAKLFQRRHSAPKALVDQSAYLSLLDPAASVEEQPREQSRGKTADSHTRLWMAAAESGSSWVVERPPTRKLIKEMNGSGRPSSSFELSDSDAEKEKGVVRRHLSKLKDLYRRAK
ncbi:hypothetical protein VTI28DRAFT_933 [Corynascus sepedonium]